MSDDVARTLSDPDGRRRRCCTPMTEAEFRACVDANRINADLLRRLRSLGLPDCHLTAGCLFQSVWNRISGKPPGWSIADYDVFYFDDADLSWDAEDRVIRLVADVVADLSVRVEVRNQARVHLWYPDRFGDHYPALASAPQGIDRYPIACTCVGIEVATGAVYAPNGFHEMARGLLRPNPLAVSLRRFRPKAESYRVRWPWLVVLD